MNLRAFEIMLAGPQHTVAWGSSVSCMHCMRLSEGRSQGAFLLCLWPCMTYRGCSQLPRPYMILPIVFPGVAATACPDLVSFLLDPAATRGHHPWRTKLQSLALFAAFLLGVSSAVCTRQPFRPLVVAPPAIQFCLGAGPAACAYSCSAPVRPRT